MNNIIPIGTKVKLQKFDDGVYKTEKGRPISWVDEMDNLLNESFSIIVHHFNYDKHNCPILIGYSVLISINRPFISCYWPSECVIPYTSKHKIEDFKSRIKFIFKSL